MEKLEGTRRSGKGSRTGLSVEYKIKNAIQKRIRDVYRMYHPARLQAIKDARVIIYPKKKDGTQSKSKLVFLKCFTCGGLFKQSFINVDHIEPVGKIPDYPFRNGELDDWTNRLFCSIDNLQVLCIPCHKAKTLNER